MYVCVFGVDPNIFMCITSFLCLPTLMMTLLKHRAIIVVISHRREIMLVMCVERVTDYSRLCLSIRHNLFILTYLLFGAELTFANICLLFKIYRVRRHGANVVATSIIHHMSIKTMADSPVPMSTKRNSKKKRRSYCNER